MSKGLAASAQKVQEHEELIAKARALETGHFGLFAKELRSDLFPPKLVRAQADDLEKLELLQNEIMGIRRKVIAEARKKGVTSVKKATKQIKLEKEELELRGKILEIIGNLTKQLEACIEAVREDQDPLKLYLKIVELKIIPEEFDYVAADLDLSLKDKILKKLEDDSEMPEEDRRALLDRYIKIVSDAADEKAQILSSKGSRDLEKNRLFAIYLASKGSDEDDQSYDSEGYGYSRDKKESIDSFGFAEIKKQILHENISGLCATAAVKGNFKLFYMLITTVYQVSKFDQYLTYASSDFNYELLKIILKERNFRLLDHYLPSPSSSAALDRILEEHPELVNLQLLGILNPNFVERYQQFCNGLDDEGLAKVLRLILLHNDKNDSAAQALMEKANPEVLERVLRVQGPEIFLDAFTNDKISVRLLNYFLSTPAGSQLLIRILEEHPELVNLELLKNLNAHENSKEFVATLLSKGLDSRLVNAIIVAEEYDLLNQCLPGLAKIIAQDREANPLLMALGNGKTDTFNTLVQRYPQLCHSLDEEGLNRALSFVLHIDKNDDAAQALMNRADPEVLERVMLAQGPEILREALTNDRLGIYCFIAGKFPQLQDEEMRNVRRDKMCQLAVDLVENDYYRFQSSITCSFIRSDKAALVTTKTLVRYHDFDSITEWNKTSYGISPDNREVMKIGDAPTYRTEFRDYKEQVINCLEFIQQIAAGNKEIATELLKIAQNLALHLKGDDPTANPVMLPDDPVMLPDDPDNQYERLAAAIESADKILNPIATNEGAASDNESVNESVQVKHPDTNFHPAGQTVTKSAGIAQRK